MEFSEPALDNLIRDLAQDLCDYDGQISSLIADTNATGWGLDEYNTPKVTEAGPTAAIIDVRLMLSGDHDDEKPFLGDTIDANIKMTVTKVGDTWEVQNYSIENISLNDDDEIEVDTE